MNYKPSQRKLYDVNGNKYNSKIDKDKYYTPINLAKYCINKTYEVIGKENITERIEAIARKLAQQEFSETLVSAGVIELEI